MHRSVQLLQPEGFDLPEILEMLNGGEIMGDIDKLFDFDTECWQSLSFSTIDDHPACFASVPLGSQEDTLEFNHPVLDEINDPMLSSCWDECGITYKHKDEKEFEQKDDKEFNKVIVEPIEKNDQPLESVSHLEDHSYYQNEPQNDLAVDGDSSNSIACNSNSSSESEVIDVEYVEPEPEPVRQTRRRYFRRNSRLQTTRNKRTMMPTKQGSRIDKSYHNELERKRRQEQRECLDYLRHRLGLSERASKKLTLNTAREQIRSLEKESYHISIVFEKEMERNRLLNMKLSELMGKY